MSPRRSLPNAAPPDLPTIKDYFGTMAKEQAEDIRLLKQAAAGKESGSQEKRPARQAKSDPWLMHPIRPSKPSSGKRGANPTTKSAAKKAPKKAAKKAAKKGSKKTRR
jgi:hypothetical protein